MNLLGKIIAVCVLVILLFVAGCTSIDDVKGIKISNGCGMQMTTTNGTTTYIPIGECNITLIKEGEKN